jgi:hypothetical protein
MGGCGVKKVKKAEIITMEEFRSRVRAQGVPREFWAFVCPICGTVQSAEDLCRTGAGDSFKDVTKFLGFSCVGRFKPQGKDAFTGKHIPGDGCNYTLGGLFTIHTLTVVDDDGKEHPYFAIATPEQAQAHMREIEAADAKLLEVAS